MVIMSEILPLEQILNQLTEMYHQILSNQNKNLTISPETLKVLKRLTDELDEFARVTDLEIARMGISPEIIRKTILGPKSQLPPDIQIFLEKSLYLKGQLQGCRNILKKIMKKQKGETPAGKRRLMEKRKDKFKNIGGKNGWIPL